MCQQLSSFGGKIKAQSRYRPSPAPRSRSAWGADDHHGAVLFGQKAANADSCSRQSAQRDLATELFPICRGNLGGHIDPPPIAEVQISCRAAVPHGEDATFKDREPANTGLERVRERACNRCLGPYPATLAARLFLRCEEAIEAGQGIIRPEGECQSLPQQRFLNDVALRHDDGGGAVIPVGSVRYGGDPKRYAFDNGAQPVVDGFPGPIGILGEEAGGLYCGETEHAAAA